MLANNDDAFVAWRSPALIAGCIGGDAALAQAYGVDVRGRRRHASGRQGRHRRDEGSQGLAGRVVSRRKLSELNFWLGQ